MVLISRDGPFTISFINFREYRSGGVVATIRREHVVTENVVPFLSLRYTHKINNKKENAQESA